MLTPSSLFLFMHRDIQEGGFLCENADINKYMQTFQYLASHVDLKQCFQESNCKLLAIWSFTSLLGFDIYYIILKPQFW